MFIQEDWDMKIDFNDFDHLVRFRRIYFVNLYVCTILLFVEHFYDTSLNRHKDYSFYFLKANRDRRNEAQESNVSKFKMFTVFSIWKFLP